MSQLLDPRCLVVPCILFAVYVCPLEHIQAKGLDDCSLSRSSLQRNELVATDKNITNVVHPQLLRFVENRGQLVDTEGNPVPEIFYYTDAGGAKLYFHRDHVSIVFSKVASGESGISEATGTPGVEPEAHPLGPQRVSYHRIDMEFVGGGSITGPQPHVLLQGYTNYYYGHHPEGITHVPGYAELIYTDLYPQIDLRFRIVDGKLKYEFIVHPGGTVSDIRIRYNGATGIRPQIDGGMKIVSPEGYALDTAPLTYQEPGTVLQSSFMLLDGDVTFTVEKYDRNRDLIIDPWATYYGGSQDDGIRGIASDASANVFVCGGSESADFPVKQALFSSFQGGVGDAVIIKLTSVGQLSWATYYGGSGGETAFDIEAGTSGEIVVSGATGSADFPTHNPYQSTLRGYSDIFLIKLSASGTAEWATFFGGSDSEGYGYVGYDQSGNIYCAAEVESLDFPTKNAFQSAYAGGVQDIAVFKFSSTYSLEWSTYYGGSASDELSSLELDSDGNPVFAGGSASTNIPLVNPTQTQLAGPSDVIIGKMSKTGSLIWSTRYGGNAAEKALGIACGPDGIIAIAGRTRSTDLPLANPIQSVAPGGMDALVAAYDSTGSFIMGGYLGGSDDDEAFGTCFDSAGKLVVVGDTKSSDFPTVAAQQAVLTGPMDAWITRTDLNGTVDWSTYYGGSDNETARQVCPATSGGVYVGGTTLSTDFPTQNPLQSAPGGKQDLFILSISSSGGVLTPPDPPSNLTGAPFTHTKAQLSWMDNSSNETSFVIEHHDGNQNWKVVATAGVDAMSLTAIDLEADHTHYFRVKAVNSLYQSDYSNILQLTMPVFPAPADLQADSVSFASLLLRWQDQSQYEDKFVIEYKTTTTTWADMMEIAKDSTSVRASGLDFMTAYQFRVRAVEGALSSPYSNVLAVSTLEFAAPANLQAVSHSAVEVRLTWEDKTDGETGFLVEFRELGGSWGIGDTAGASTTKFLLGGLQPSTTYEFRVRALYRDLKSGTSNIAQATTL
ncbi:MAG: fibronectin type III domain-containing protein, partial [Bacteroidetes bacterium]|nr:fibronectin type III domain-containing protein [Bacteroidota bacterium]